MEEDRAAEVGLPSFLLPLLYPALEVGVEACEIPLTEGDAVK
jgi:hypothetical protein